MLNVSPIHAFSDNYIWLIRSEGTDKRVAVVDPGDSDPVVQFLDNEKLELAAILITHHHGDHVGGVRELVARFDVPVYGPAGESNVHRSSSIPWSWPSSFITTIPATSGNSRGSSLQS